MQGSFLEDSGRANGSIGAVYLEVDGSPMLDIFPLNYSYKSNCALLGSPSETGVQQYDHKVRKPATVSFTGIVKYSSWDVLEEMRESIRSHDLGKILCTLYTKSGRAERMMIETLEEIGDNSRYDGVEVKVSLTEYLEHNVASGK